MTAAATFCEGALKKVYDVGGTLPGKSAITNFVSTMTLNTSGARTTCTTAQFVGSQHMASEEGR